MVKNRVVRSHSVLGRVVSEELPEEVTLSRDLNEAKDFTVQTSEGRVFRQREQHVQWSGTRQHLDSRNSKKASVVRVEWVRPRSVRRGGWIGRETMQALTVPWGVVLREMGRHGGFKQRHDGIKFSLKKCHFGTYLENQLSWETSCKMVRLS